MLSNNMWCCSTLSSGFVDSLVLLVLTNVESVQAFEQSLYNNKLNAMYIMLSALAVRLACVKRHVSLLPQDMGTSL